MINFWTQNVSQEFRDILQCRIVELSAVCLRRERGKHGEQSLFPRDFDETPFPRGGTRAQTRRRNSRRSSGSYQGEPRNFSSRSALVYGRGRRVLGEKSASGVSRGSWTRESTRERESGPGCMHLQPVRLHCMATHTQTPDTRSGSSRWVCVSPTHFPSHMQNTWRRFEQAAEAGAPRS